MAFAHLHGGCEGGRERQLRLSRLARPRCPSQLASCASQLAGCSAHSRHAQQAQQAPSGWVRAPRTSCRWAAAPRCRCTRRRSGPRGCCTCGRLAGGLSGALRAPAPLQGCVDRRSTARSARRALASLLSPLRPLSAAGQGGAGHPHAEELGALGQRRLLAQLACGRSGGRAGGWVGGRRWPGRAGTASPIAAQAGWRGGRQRRPGSAALRRAPSRAARSRAVGRRRPCWRAPGRRRQRQHHQRLPLTVAEIGQGHGGVGAARRHVAPHRDATRVGGVCGHPAGGAGLEAGARAADGVHRQLGVPGPAGGAGRAGGGRQASEAGRGGEAGEGRAGGRGGGLPAWRQAGCPGAPVPQPRRPRSPAALTGRWEQGRGTSRRGPGSRRLG